MFGWLVKIKESADTFFERIENYIATRVSSGKVFLDVFNLGKGLLETSITFLIWVSHTKIFRFTVALLSNVFIKLNTVPSVARIGDMILAQTNLLKKYYTEFLMAFSFIQIPCALILLLTFESSPNTFFLLFFPISIVIVSYQSLLYLLIDRNEKEEKKSWQEGIKQVLTRLPSIMLLFFFFLFLLALCVTVFALMVGILTILLNMLGSQWISLVFYWFTLFFVGSWLMIGFFLLEFMFYQAYFIALIDKKGPIVALFSSKQFLKTNFSQLLFYNITFSLCYLPLLYLGIFYLWDVGFVLVICLIVQLRLLLHWRLKNKFIDNSLEFNNKPSKAFTATFWLIFALGICSYIAIAAFTSHYYPEMYQSYVMSEEKNNISANLLLYQDQTYHYTISYPKYWTIYHWKSNAVRFFTNYTGTLVGIVWLEVTVSPVNESPYSQLYTSNPGLVSFDDQTQTIISKISNISIQGNNGIEYTVIQPGPLTTEYQTHYLIRKGNMAYDVSYVTHDIQIEDTNSTLLKQLIDSFQFLQK